jgi:transposase
VVLRSERKRSILEQLINKKLKEAPMKKYIVRLTHAQRQFLSELTHARTATTRMQMRARILLKADQGEHGPSWHDQQIIDALEVGHATVERARKQFVEGGLQAALFPQQARSSRRGKLDGEQEAHLIAICCSAAPKGRKRWSLRLLAHRLVELEIVEEISHETVRATLKKIS